MVWAGSSPPDIVRGAVVVALVAVATATFIAITVRVAGLASATRSLLGLSFAGMPATPTEAMAISGQNAALAACAFLGVAGVQADVRLRPLVDLALATLLLVNSGAVGLAAGAYGTQVLTPHIAIEAVAFCISGGAYLATRRGSPCAMRLARAVFACLALTAIAAILEVGATDSPSPSGARTCSASGVALYMHLKLARVHKTVSSHLTFTWPVRVRAPVSVVTTNPVALVDRPPGAPGGSCWLGRAVDGRSRATPEYS